MTLGELMAALERLKELEKKYYNNELNHEQQVEYYLLRDTELKKVEYGDE